MGRRAKNKQGDPESLQELVEHASPKKLGKRKADTVIVRQQPAKKVKNSVYSTQKHATSANSKGTSKHKSEYESELQVDNSWNGIKEDGNNGGWEDIQDRPTQTRCVVFVREQSGHTSHNPNAVDRCFRIAICPQLMPPTPTSTKTRTRMYLSQHRTSQPGLVHSTPGPLEKLSLTQKSFRWRHRPKRMS